MTQYTASGNTLFGEMHRTFKLSLAAFLLIATSLHAAGKRQIVLATAEGRTPGAAATELTGIVTHVNADSDLGIVVKTFPSYDAAYAAFRDGKADLLVCGAVKYVEAHHETKALAVVAEAPRLQESIIVVTKESPLKTVGDLKGKKFAFGYDNSTSTHLMPLLLFSKAGVTVNDLAKHDFLGTEQEKIVTAVSSGAYDAGAVTSVVYEAHKDRLRILERSEPFPGATVVAHSDIDPKLLAALRSRFLSYKPEGAEVKQRFGHGAAPIVDADFNKIRFLCKVLFKKTYL
jgi:phosphonate transport system substrate-binding protein